MSDGSPTSDIHRTIARGLTVVHGHDDGGRGAGGARRGRPGVGPAVGGGGHRRGRGGRARRCGGAASRRASRWGWGHWPPPSAIGGRSPWSRWTTGWTGGGSTPGSCGRAGSWCGPRGSRWVRWAPTRWWSRSTRGRASATAPTRPPGSASRPSTACTPVAGRCSTSGAGAGSWPSPPCCSGRPTPSRVDIDPAAVAATRANAERNGVADRITTATALSGVDGVVRHRRRQHRRRRPARAGPGARRPGGAGRDARPQRPPRPTAAGPGRPLRPAGGRGRRAPRRLDRPGAPLTQDATTPTKNSFWSRPVAPTRP